jgi:hypothetical protein
MKAKSLLIAGAALAASLMTSKAQVYSQNIVGYINVPVPTGYSIVGNQLDLDGTGTNNTVTTVLGTNSVPVGLQVLTWNGSAFSIDSFSILPRHTTPSWSNPTLPLNPGTGFFVYNPGTVTNITEVGNVIVGTNSNPQLVSAGYSLLGAVSPVGGDLVTNLDYTPSIGDQVLTYGSSGYSISTYSILPRHTTPSWSPGVPQISVGQGFFLSTTNTSPNWTQILNVQ